MSQRQTSEVKLLVNQADEYFLWNDLVEIQLVVLCQLDDKVPKIGVHPLVLSVRVLRGLQIPVGQRFGNRKQRSVNCYPVSRLAVFY